MVRQVRPEDVKARLDAGEPVYFLDVRQPGEFAVCRIPGSVLIPLGELPGRLAKVDPPAGAAVVVVCHHGVRSLTGAYVVQEAGFPDVASLAGGIDAWSVRVDPTVPRY